MPKSLKQSDDEENIRERLVPERGQPPGPGGNLRGGDDIRGLDSSSGTLNSFVDALDVQSLENYLRKRSLADSVPGQTTYGFRTGGEIRRPEQPRLRGQPPAEPSGSSVDCRVDIS